MIILRPDQVRFKAEIYGEWQSGRQNVLGVAPTGFGKSVVVADIVRDMQLSRQSCAVIAHRNELVTQLSEHLGRRGVVHNVIAQAKTVGLIRGKHRKIFQGQCFVNNGAAIHVIGVDTLLSRGTDLGGIQNWIIDEAHHVIRTNKWGKAAELMPRARGLGVTASPSRADGQGLGRNADGVFDTMVMAPTMRELIDAGNLCDYMVAVPETDFVRPDRVGVEGDFTRAALREASEKSHIVGDCVTHYMRYALGKRTIVFATDVATAEKIAEQFRDAGIRAAAVSGETEQGARDKRVEMFRDGELDVLVNVDLFGEGFDVPACDCVIMARPTQSLAVYLQQFGRALRTSPGKKYGLIIDMVGNVRIHGLPDKPHRWTLDRREKRAKSDPDPELVPVTVCRSCTMTYERTHSACPYCGHEPVKAGTGRTLEQVDGDLTLLSPEILAQMRQALTLEAPAALMDRVTMAAGPAAGKAAYNRQLERIASQEALAHALALWGGVQRAKGRGDSEIYRRFYAATGQSMNDVLAAPRADMDAMREVVTKWLS